MKSSSLLGLFCHTRTPTHSCESMLVVMKSIISWTLVLILLTRQIMAYRVQCTTSQTMSASAPTSLRESVVACATRVTGLGTTWFYGTSSARPKQTAIDHGVSQGHSVFLERVTTYGRQFGSYQNVEALSTAVGNNNLQLFEVITGNCKLYFDVEYSGSSDELSDILLKIQNGSSELLGVDVAAADFRISCATGIGESATFKDQVKHSYHIVVDNGYSFASTKHARTFVDMVFSDDTRVDRSPYGRNQVVKNSFNSFRLFACRFNSFHQTSLTPSTLNTPPNSCKLGHSGPWNKAPSAVMLSSLVDAIQCNLSTICMRSMNFSLSGRLSISTVY